MSTKKILVTGANGQLGMELRALEKDFSAYKFVFVSREQLPIDNKSAIDTVFENEKPDWCINCAAYTAVDKAETEQELAFLINGAATGYLAAAAEKNNCGFVHISTDYVFDGTATDPLMESDPVSPVNVYGASKLEGEMLAFQYHSAPIVIRTSWVYSSYGKNFVKTMMRLMQERSTISVVSDQIGSPTYAADLAKAILKLIALEKEVSPGIYNYSNDAVISWYEFAVAIKELTKSSCEVNPIPSSAYPTPAKRPAYSVMSKEKFKLVFGQEISPWKESLEVCIRTLSAETHNSGRD